MTISKKSLTITIAVLSAIGLGFFVFDSPKESNDRSTSQSLDSDLFETPALSSITDDGELLENIEVLNQEIMVLRKNQKEVFEKVEELVTALQKLDDQQYLTSLEQANVTESEGNPNNALQPSDGEITQARTESYETDLMNQDIDSGWNDLVHGKVESMIEDQSFSNSSIVSMDCRDTLCKLDMTHADEDAMENFLGEFPHQMAWNNDSFIKTEEQGDGSMRSMIYFSRDGHSLPGSDQTQNDL